MTDSNGPQQIVFIDSRVPDIQDLLAGLQPGEEAFVLDPNSDGIQQIANILAANNITNLSAISIVSHGETGELALGSSLITDSNLAADSNALAEIGASLAPGGAIQLYGCDVAQGTLGQQFINDFSTYAGGVQVDAATHIVGSAALGGSWTLDAVSNESDLTASAPNGGSPPVSGATSASAIEPAFTSAALANFQGTLAASPVDRLFVLTDGGGHSNTIDYADNTGNNTASNSATLYSNNTTLSQPVDIALDTTDNAYFFVDSVDGSSSGNNRILEGTLSQAVNAPSAAPTFTTVYSDTHGDFDGIQALAVDPIHQQIYFAENLGPSPTFDEATFERVNYNGTGLTTLATVSVAGVNIGFSDMALDTADNTAYFVASAEHEGDGYVTLTANYIYKATGVTSTATSATMSQLPVVSAGNFLVPASLGAVEGIAFDAVNDTLYFTTDPTSTQSHGGIFSYALSGNPNGTFGTVWLQPTPQSMVNGHLTSEPFGDLSYITVDAQTGQYYVSDGEGFDTFNNGMVTGSLGDDSRVYIGSLTSTAAPSAFLQISVPVNGVATPQGLALDNAPSLSVASALPTFTESVNNPASLNNTPVRLLTSATASDSDNVDLASATVSIGGFFAGDTLTFSNINAVNGSYASSTGVLTFTGIDNLADYQTALASVQFTSTSDNPTDYGSDTSRTLTWTVSDGLLTNAPATSTVSVVGVNDPPTLLNVASSAHFTEDTAVTLSNAVTVSDPDNLDLASATVSVASGGFTGDVLSINGQTSGTIINGANTITLAYNAGTETLTLTGSDTLADYQAALDKAEFNSTSLNPTDYGSTVTRSVTWVLNDGSGSFALSSPNTTTVSVTAVNNPPTLTGTANASFTENNGLVELSPNVTVSDPDNLTLTSATVQITGGTFAGDGDMLAAVTTNAANITATYSTSSETLVLSGTDTLADYQFVLDSVRFNSNSQNPTDYGSAPNRTVTWTLDDGSASNQFSTPQTSTINITAVNNPPTLQNVASSASFTEGTAVTLSNAVTVSDPDNLDLASATISVTGGKFAGDDDVLSINGQTSGTIINGANTITLAYNAGSETLTLTGSDTLADYQAALDKAEFNSTSANPDDFGASTARSVTWVLNDGSSVSNFSSPNTTTVSITAINNPPTLSGTANASFTENALTPVTLSSVAAVSDPDSLTLASATVALTGGTFSGDGDMLSFSAGTVATNITETWSSSSETLVLHGSDSLAAYQSVLDSVTFTTPSDNPTNFGSDPTRTVVWTLNDGSGSNATSSVTTTIGITAINDPPTLSGIAASVTVVPGQTVTLSPSATVSDPDSLDLAFATVAITGGTFAGDGDMLGFSTAGTSISASYSTSTETLLLSGSDTLANYAKVLDSITFNSTAADPTNGGADPNRTVSWTANDGSTSFSLSQTVLTNIQVALGPAVGPAATASYTEGQAMPTPLSPSVALIDTNGTVLVSATVALTSADISNGTFGPFGQLTGDMLGFDTGGTSISAAYNASTETLILSGTDTLTDYQKVLDSITFSTPSQNPTDYGSDPTRLVTWTVNDGAASHSTSTATSTIDITAVNNPPTLSGVPASAAFTEGNGAVSLSPVPSAIAVSDPDSLDLASATVSISGGFFGGDVLSAGTSGGAITASYSSSTGVLVLNGSDTLADYQALLSQVTFNSTSQNPTDYGSDTTRTLTWQVNDGSASSALSNVETSTIDVTAVNNPPTLAGVPATFSYTEGNGALPLASVAVVSDPDSLDLASATVAITAGDFTGDALGFTLATAGTNITATYSSASETLTLSGSDTLANYQSVLDSVTFVSSSSNPTDYGSDPTRTVVWTLNDGSASNATSSVTSAIDITAVNNAPTLSGTAASVSFTEGGGAVGLSSLAVVSDPDNLDLAGATVSISSGTFAGDGDVFGYNTGGTNITVSLATSGEALILAGSDTLANYQQVLDSVTFNSTSANPDNFGTATTRTVVWTLDDGSASNAFGTATTTVDITAVNNPPTLSGVTNVSYLENTAPVHLAGSAVVSDPDSRDLGSATVAVTSGNFTGDALGFTLATAGTNITATYSSASETLTLTGSDTLANYQSVLDSITFVSSSANPTDYGSDPTRTVVWTLNDGSASNAVSSVTSMISITAVNNPPTLSGTAASISFTERGGPVGLSTLAIVSDPDNLDLASATVSISSGAFAGDVLAANTTGTHITATYNSSTEKLILSGSDTIANYQSVLDSVTFNSTSLNPDDYGSDLSRLVVWTVNDGSGASNATASATETVNVTAVNDPPTLAHVPAVDMFHISKTLTVAPTLTLTDPDSLKLSSATVAITGGTFSGDGDVLSINGQTSGTIVNGANTITVSYSTSSETLTLSGSDTPADYQAALDRLTFSSGINPTDGGLDPTRTLTWEVNDGASSNSLSLPATTTISVAPTVKNDFNGDQISDILFQDMGSAVGVRGRGGDPSAGAAEIFGIGSGMTVASETLLTPNPGTVWHIAATGDFNADGNADIVWQSTDGTPMIWTMNGASVTNQITFTAQNPGSSWRLVASGDFNDDGNTDLVFQNTDGTPMEWLMNGTSVAQTMLLPDPGASWKLVGTGDFDGDGKSDLVFQNTTTDAAQIWLMNGSTVTSEQTLSSPGVGWSLIGTGDFNGDGKSDLLFQNTDGTPQVWLMNGTSVAAMATLANPFATAIGTGDFNGDGKSDILFQNAAGAPIIYAMNGTTVASTTQLQSPGPTWHANTG